MPQRLTGPFDLPLWFLRDLFIVQLFTPVLYYCIKKLKITFVVILFILYITRLIPQIPGFNIDAFMFFSIGACFALHDTNVVDFSNRYVYITVPVSIILCVISTLCWGRTDFFYGCIQSVFCLVGIFPLFFFSSMIVEKYHIKPSRSLLSSCFFIYALHAAPIPYIGSILHITKTTFGSIVGESLFANYLSYFSVPLITTFICIMWYRVSNILLPRVTLLLSGKTFIK